MKGAYIIPEAFLNQWAISPNGAQRAKDVIAEFAQSDTEREMFMDQLKPAPLLRSDADATGRRALPRRTA